MAQRIYDDRKEAEKAGAEQQDEDDEGESGWKPQTRSHEGFSPMMSTLYSVLDAVNEIPRTLIAVNGKKPPPKPKLRLPVSALDVLELSEERDEMHDLAERFGMRRSR